MMDNKDELTFELQKALAEKEIMDKVNVRVRRKTSWVLLFLSFMSLVLVTFAWFTISTLANVEKLDMSIGTAPDLRISTENHGSNFKQYVKTVTDKMIDKELTDRFNTTMKDQILDPVTSSNTFLEFDLYLIATKDLTVHITNEIDKENKIKGTGVSTTETGAKADIVKAVRFSFTNEEGKTIIYEPNKGTAVAGQTTFDLSRPMVYSNANKVCELKKLTPQKVTVRVWFEGEDPECVNRIQESTMEAILTFGGEADAS